QAADDAQVNTGVIYPFPLDQLAKLPLGAELFAGGQGDRCPGTQRLERVGILRPERVFNEERPERLNLLTEPECIGQVQASMDIKGQLDLLANGFANRLELFDSRADGRAWFQYL